VLVTPGDPVALAAAIIALIDDPGAARAMGERGRRHVVELDPAAAFDAGIERLARWIASP
jgi:hypothetical protein